MEPLLRAPPKVWSLARLRGDKRGNDKKTEVILDRLIHNAYTITLKGESRGEKQKTA